MSSRCGSARTSPRRSVRRTIPHERCRVGTASRYSRGGSQSRETRRATTPDWVRRPVLKKIRRQCVEMVWTLQSRAAADSFAVKPAIAVNTISVSRAVRCHSRRMALVRRMVAGARGKPALVNRRTSGSAKLEPNPAFGGILPPMGAMLLLLPHRHNVNNPTCNVSRARVECARGLMTVLHCDGPTPQFCSTTQPSLETNAEGLGHAARRGGRRTL